mmetsp:Transcript_12565/g.12188  ORF Transcript_12565/g.12188 Transcript_12565/m.12188 type:complete len:320 (+) Transcript_12565:88-1047(+)
MLLSQNFPLVIKPKERSRSSDLNDYIQNKRNEIDNLLLTHGAILFRGYEIYSAEDFDSIVVSTQLNGMEYLGGAAVRTQITPRVFTANESPSSEKIPFHHEMSQVPQPPTHLFFYCETAPKDGGETPILKSSEVCRRLTEIHPDFMDRLKSQGVKYVRYMSRKDDSTSAIGRGWEATYLTNTKEGAESALTKQGSSFEWLPGDVLKTITKPLPAVRTDRSTDDTKRTGTTNFFNSIVAAYTGWNDSRNRGSEAVVLGDGTPVPAVFIKDAVAIMDEICVALPWERGDVLLIDNRTVMHSRRPFQGPRRILASLVRDPAR